MKIKKRLQFFLVLNLFILSCSSNSNPQPAPEPQLPACGQLVDNSPRGLATLHCNVTSARPQCEQLVSIMRDACIKRPAINYLVDDVFGANLGHMNHDVHMLSSEGREPHVLFYLTNGPWQRRCNSHRSGPWDVKNCPDQFRHLIQTSADIQQKFRDRLLRILPLIATIQAMNGTVYVVPMLEDNLDKHAFSASLNLLMPILPPGVRIGRNSCGGCYSGNDTSIPAGVFEEDHVSGPWFNAREGVITNDGKTYLFPGERSHLPVTSLDNLRQARDRAAGFGDWFILWKGDFQGLTSSNLPDPGQRNYVSPLPHRQTLINFLRGQ